MEMAPKLISRFSLLRLRDLFEGGHSFFEAPTFALVRAKHLATRPNPRTIVQTELLRPSEGAVLMWLCLAVVVEAFAFQGP